MRVTDLRENKRSKSEDGRGAEACPEPTDGSRRPSRRGATAAQPGRDHSRTRPTPVGRADAGREMIRQTPRLRAVAMRIVRDREAAEDVVQAGIEKALRKLEQFDGRALFSTWLHRIVVNEALLWLRNEKRYGQRLEEAAGSWPVSRDRSAKANAESQLIAAERARALRRGLRRLPQAEREVLVACALEGIPHRDFARRHGLAVPTVKSRAFRARQRLQSLLEDIG